MRVLHVFRTPVGGLFRHVRDLARGQKDLGHEVGILCDSLTGGDGARQLLQTADAHCSLGIRRIPISRMPGLGDISGARQTKIHARSINADVIHCHGAKGGVYGRLAARSLGIPSVYTPHGGSLHFKWMSASGAVFLGAEWLLARLGCGFHFVCDFEKQEFDRKVGIGGNPTQVIHNGLWPEELELAKPTRDASDILFFGELRDLKGVDLLIAAIGKVRRSRRITATIVGDGPDSGRYKAMVDAAGLTADISFAGRLPAAEAFRRGRVLFIPSRNESFPYAVLEAMAAGVPVFATEIGGIGEALPRELLFPPEDIEAICGCLMQALDEPARLSTLAMANREAIRGRFSAAKMAANATAFYAKCQAS